MELFIVVGCFNYNGEGVIDTPPKVFKSLELAKGYIKSLPYEFEYEHRFMPRKDESGFEIWNVDGHDQMNIFRVVID